MINYRLTILILLATACMTIFLLVSGCSLYVSIEGKKKCNHIVEPAKKVVEPVKPVQPKKSNYQKLKDEYKEEWLNLPNKLPQDHLEQIKNQ